MTGLDRYAIEVVETIKHLDPGEQAAALEDLAGSSVQCASSVRSALENIGGSVVTVAIQGSDRDVVLLSLLAMVAQDIATLPDFQLQARSMVVHDEVIACLGLTQLDAAFFRNNSNLLARILTG